LNDLFNSKNISKQIYKALLPDVNNKIGKFRILAKLHKKDFAIRPIINCKNHFTEKISIFIDHLLKPIIENSESYLKDSQNLLQIVNNLTLSDNLELYSCDFSTLYTNIKLDDALYYTMFSLVNKIDSIYVTPYGLYELLKLVLYNNVFSYLNRFFKQIKGLAMGSNLGPSIANTVVYNLEIKWLKVHKPLIYKRFIDDIFIESENSIDINEFTNTFDYLKLNICNDKTVQFLDLEISLDKLYNKLNFSLYIKKTNTFSYLNVNSNHPKHIFKNIPKSLFIRVRRICTKFTDYLYYCRLIYLHLIKCGYDANLLDKLINIIGRIDRKELIDYKVKNTIKPKDNNKKLFLFKLQYTNQFDLKSLLLNSSKEVLKDDKFSEIKLYQFYTVNNNIRDLLIHRKKFCNYKYNNTSKCLNISCKTCTFINTIDKIEFNNGIVLPLISSSNCNAKDCIYILYCEICDSYYVGQSKDFKRRFPNHLSTIKNYQFNKSDCELAKHFNQLDHINIFDTKLKWTIFASKIINFKLRLSTEQEIIRLFKDCGNKIINEKIFNKSIRSFYTQLKLLET
jgi:hypothetical protein